MTSPPIPPSAASRRGDLPSHTRAEPAARPHMLSDTRAIATNDEPQEQELQGHMPPARIGELRQHRGHEDCRLGVGDPNDVALPEDPSGAARRRRRIDHAREALPVPEGLHAQEHHVHRADELDRGEERRRALDERPEPERDDDHLRVRAGGVPEHRRDRRTAASATPRLMTKSRLGPGTTISANAVAANASRESVGTTSGEDTGVV